MLHQKKSTVKTACVEAFPLAIAIAAYGMSYGVLAMQVNFSLLTTVAMSVFVFSGSAQLVTVAMLAGGAGLTSVLLTVILLNLRNLLYGAALAEGIEPAKKWTRLLAFGVTDEPFVLASARFKKVGPDPTYFAVVAAIFYIAWIFASFFGALIGNQLDPQKWGLDLAFPVTFAALLVPGLKGKPVIGTALTAVILALCLEGFKPGNELTIILTGLLAPLVGLFIHRRTSHA
ncbi:AzlC family ABC transporter permease [Sporolactobacillus shoreicorticis]|uniref:AzlC family ABC transporter permease n=1 Tax=Sporolactobacillus shoreicorticis TaxID=1923877 RepID=A0ABW5S2J3_9BACL|nr:AzlC family ABC transporter permease [Sporolactobacillus shoreicorticis]MCO7128293.1 AzlC family ABC transporter permease [Sporolactobacillus shoreicorticis]